MPEGPEVRIVARQLNKSLGGWTLTKISIKSGPYVSNASAKYLDFRLQVKKFSKAVLAKVGAKGKMMYWELTPSSSDNLVVNTYLMIGFGMTGGFKFNSGGNHTRIIFHFAKGDTTKTVEFVDQRNFGTLKFVKREELNEKLSSLGPDIFSVSEEEFVKQFGYKGVQNNEIAKAMLNQKIVSGIGNYLRAEIIYRAGINALAKVKDLSALDLAKLHAATKEVIKEVLQQGGSPHYKDTVDKSGKYKFRVYMQTTAPNGKHVRKAKLAGRVVHYV